VTPTHYAKIEDGHASSWSSLQGTSDPDLTVGEKDIPKSLSYLSLSRGKTHSFMAPHDSDSAPVCTDNLQELFGLAHALLNSESSATPTFSNFSGQDVKVRM